MKLEKHTANEPDELVPFLHCGDGPRHVSRRNRVDGAREKDHEAPDPSSKHPRRKCPLSPLVAEIVAHASGQLGRHNHAEPVVQASGAETRGPCDEFPHCRTTWDQGAHGGRHVCALLQILIGPRRSPSEPGALR